MTGLTDVEAATAEVVRTYDRMAPVYDALDGIYEWSWKRRLRAELFRHARGRVLDVGVGTGCNMPFYPAGSEVVGIDSSRRMLAEARQRAARLGCVVTLREMNLLQLDYPDHAFDSVVATFVLLCLPEALIPTALAELVRVTRPEGRLLLLDYHLSSRPAARLWMRCVSPWLRWAFAARYDAGTERHVEAAGLQVLERRAFAADSVTMIVARPG
jgi:phosphatidylethanolamine/phosphatidyl-N-methylethanolamine N-methyltransferase